MGFAILTYHSGLFGLYDLDIQTKVNFHSHSSKWPQINEKSVKFWFSMVSGLWFGLHDLHRPFSIFLRSLMSKKSSDMQQSYIRALFHQKQFLLEISHFGSLCYGPQYLSIWIVFTYNMGLLDFQSALFGKFKVVDLSILDLTGTTYYIHQIKADEL